MWQTQPFSKNPLQTHLELGSTCLPPAGNSMLSATKQEASSNR
jgi:hypothetical protein